MDTLQELIEVRRIAIEQRDRLAQLEADHLACQEELRAIRASCRRAGYETGTAVMRVNALCEAIAIRKAFEVRADPMRSI